jgi:hypothetical protein
MNVDEICDSLSEAEDAGVLIAFWPPVSRLFRLMLFQHETEKWQYQSAGAIDH